MKLTIIVVGLFAFGLSGFGAQIPDLDCDKLSATICVGVADRLGSRSLQKQLRELEEKSFSKVLESIASDRDILLAKNSKDPKGLALKKFLQEREKYFGKQTKDRKKKEPPFSSYVLTEPDYFSEYMVQFFKNLGDGLETLGFLDDQSKRNIWEQVKKDTLAAIDSQTGLSAEEKKEFRMSVQLVVMLSASEWLKKSLSENSTKAEKTKVLKEFLRACTMTEGGFADRIRNVLALCPGVSYFNTDKTSAQSNMREVLAHELGHFMETPWELPKGYQSFLDSPFVRQRKGMLDCLKNSVPHSERLPKIEPAMFTPSGDFNEALHHYDEIIADYWASESLAIALAREPREKRLELLTGAVQVYCVLEDPTHLKARDRIDYVYGRNDKIRGLLGCKSRDEQKYPYCRP